MIYLQKIRRLIKDFGLNFLASILTVALAQILLFPMLARMYSAEQYGIILTLYGVANTIIGTFGGSLNNTRLIVNSRYEEKKGDFIVLLIISTFAGVVSIFIYNKLYIQLDGGNIFFIILYVFAGILVTYGNVAFRLKINYKKIFFNSVFTAFGQCIGMVLIIYVFPNYWTIAFAFGQMLSCLYIFFRSDIFLEPITITKFFCSTIQKNAILIITTLSANVLTYLDRLLMLPILGGDAVSSYTTAAFFGKTLGMATTPIAGVFLTYFAQKDYKMTKKRFWLQNLIILACSTIFYCFSLIAAVPITNIMYPKLVNSAIPYMHLANLTAIISLNANMTQPAVLMFSNTYWQIFIQTVYCITYMGLGVIGVKYSGLYGFAIAALIASIIRLLLLYGIGHFSMQNDSIG